MAEEHKKIFLYCTETVNSDIAAKFRHKGYSLYPLTSDAATGFWPAIGAAAANATIVIFSHGDGEGPLMIKGHDGPSMTDSEILSFCSLMVLVEAKVYLLSCHTGSGSFAAKLKKHGVDFIAPKGYASVGASIECLTIKSVEHEDGTGTAGWEGFGIRTPTRSGLGLP